MGRSDGRLFRRQRLRGQQAWDFESDAEQIERMPSGSSNEVYVKIKSDRATSQPTGCSMVKYGVDAGAMRLKSIKSVPKVPSDSTGQQRRFAEPYPTTDTLTGRRGSLIDRAVTFRDLIEVGFLLEQLNHLRRRWRHLNDS